MKAGRSLYRELLGWTLGALLVVWSAFIWIGYRTGVEESDELTDGHLASVASVLLFTDPASLQRPAVDAARSEMPAQLKAHDYQQSLSFVVWDGSGKLISRSGQAPAPPFGTREGFETMMLGDPPARWRSFTRRESGGQGRKVSVLLSLQERDELAGDIAAQVATPGLWLLPVVALVLSFAVRKGLRPLRDLSGQVNRLDVNRDTLLHAPPHEEFVAIVQSIDRLTGRYKAALARERELASEVAHELRTPLASLRLHAAALGQNLPAQEACEVYRQIELDAQRAGQVLTDLLALARASRTELAEAAEAVDLAALARRVAAEFGQAALECGHELCVEAPDSCPVDGHRVAIELALRNLVENALAHTPRGSSVTVRVHRDPSVLEVRDDGAALEQSAEAPVQRRHLGLGLGHQLVRRVATIHGGRFEAQPPSASGERCYRIVFPSRRGGERSAAAGTA